MIVETAILESLEAIVSSLGVSVVSHNKVVDSLNNIMSCNSWSSILHALANLWQFLVLVVQHAADFALLGFSELSHVIIVIIVVASLRHVDEFVALIRNCTHT